MGNEIEVSNNLPAVSGGSSGTGFQDRASEIRHVMRTDIDRYRREGLSQELAEINQRENESERTSLTPLPSAKSEALFKSSPEGVELASAWKRAPGGFAAQLALAQRAASQIVSQAGSYSAQLAFTEQFNRDVTERARYHVYNEFRHGSVGNALPVSNEDLSIFGNTRAGAELIEEWGAQAPYRVARVWARFARFERTLNDAHDFQSLVAWYSKQKPEMVKAICRHLSA